MDATIPKAETAATFAFLEAKRLAQLATRIERALEAAGPALLAGRLRREEHRELVRRLRRKIDAVAELTRELQETVE